MSTTVSASFSCFSALQRAEIAEIDPLQSDAAATARFSALQRAEIAEICARAVIVFAICICFSALQRAEIAEIGLAMRKFRMY